MICRIGWNGDKKMSTFLKLEASNLDRAVVAC